MQRLFLIILFSCCVINIFSQDDIILEVTKRESEAKKAISKRLKKNFGKKVVMEYKNSLFIPYMDIININLSNLKYENQKGIPINELPKNRDIQYLKLPEQLTYQAIIYNDSLTVLAVDCIYTYRFDALDKSLLKYYLTLNADLLFFATVDDGVYCVLIDNKIYKLVYNEGTNSFSKVEL